MKYYRIKPVAAGSAQSANFVAVFGVVNAPVAVVEFVVNHFDDQVAMREKTADWPFHFSGVAMLFLAASILRISAQ